MNARKLFYLGIPVIFIIGTVFHFIYELTGSLFAVGHFAPVNESIFEHMKLALVPTALWYIPAALLAKEKPESGKWFAAMLISQLVSALLMPLIFYGYTQAFGVKSTLVDILIYLVSTAAGQLLATHFYRYGKAPDYRLSLALSLLLIALLRFLPSSRRGCRYSGTPSTAHTAFISQYKILCPLCARARRGIRRRHSRGCSGLCPRSRPQCLPL